MKWAVYEASTSQWRCLYLHEHQIQQRVARQQHSFDMSVRGLSSLRRLLLPCGCKSSAADLFGTLEIVLFEAVCSVN